MLPYSDIKNHPIEGTAEESDFPKETFHWTGLNWIHNPFLPQLKKIQVPKDQKISTHNMMGLHQVYIIFPNCYFTL